MLDVSALVVIALASVVYLRCYQHVRGTAAAGRGQVWWFMLGIAVWALATFSAVGVYAPVLFWVRALQVLLLLLVAPFLLALGRPLATISAASVSAGRVVQMALDSKPIRVASSPLATSIAMLATPWLLYLTPWYVASMTGPVATVTRLLLVFVGFGYFYARLQADPVPRRFSPLVSIGISVVESLADGVLGVVLWLGPLIASDYYAALQRNWGPSMRTDQSIGAGILWIAGDVLSIPFVLVLMRQLGSHERRRAAQVDAELEEAPQSPTSTLWWENDPQLRERFRT
ncbi:cytochrome c oxidase assembly protein [Mycolicibacterium sphagni]|uniref:Copper resistance protein CopD n=1 Tax=Mycolicibacterium sphagni TaxID=1786 RepID=A0A255DH23_9MYCO|nr:cytochrome c oxidase assembly protein [Mycolicibacterium sphagni]OYN78676.1 copper resistance protein CopD [Mycolicibacterium sphagni]